MKKNSQEEKTEKTEDQSGIEKVYAVEERLYPKRALSVFFFIVITILFAAINAYLGGLATGGLICAALIIIPVCLTCVLFMMDRRREGELWYADTDYLSFVLIYALSNVALTFLSEVTPAYLMPAAVAVFLMMASGNSTLTVMASMLSVVSVGFGHRYQGSAYALFICEAVMAVAVSDEIIRAKKTERIFLLILVAAVQMALPVSVRYFDKLSLSKNELFFSCGLSIITGVAAVFVMPLLYRRLHSERAFRYDTILDDDYSLINEIKLFSEDEYERARRLSVASLKAAQEIGADAHLAAAGGLYYRVGLIRGDREIEYAVQIAAEHSFPEALTRILYEYQGLIRRPTSRESAIVHMADAVLRRLDAIAEQGDQMESGWNRQMLVYSVCNELSNSGFYDDSGLTMNQFLRIRETLVSAL